MHKSKFKFDIEDAKEIAKSRGGYCLSRVYRSSPNKLKWKCENGHIWCATFSSVKGGTWCFKCANHFTIDNAKKLVESKGLEFIKADDKEITLSTNIHFKCANGHRCKTKLKNIKTTGKCRLCAIDSFKIGIEPMRELAEKKGGLCLSKAYKNNNSKLIWQCEAKHQWKTAPKNIVNGAWCPICKTKKQQALYDIVSDIYGKQNTRYNYKEFAWLRNEKTGHKQEIDIFVKSIQLAIEYDGEQHFIPVKFSNKMTDQDAEDNLKHTKQRDRRKNRIIKEHPEDVKYFIRFSYKEKISKEYVLSRLEKENIPFFV